MATQDLNAIAFPTLSEEQVAKLGRYAGAPPKKFRHWNPTSLVCQLSHERGKTMIADGTCAHLSTITTVKHATRRECEECVKIGGQWVHLRTCQTCGATLCCDNSPNRHASRHAQASGHPVIASAQPNEHWLYCYPDDAFAEY